MERHIAAKKERWKKRERERERERLRERECCGVGVVLIDKVRYGEANVNQDIEVINGLMYSLRQTPFQYERKRKRSLENRERKEKDRK